MRRKILLFIFFILVFVMGSLSGVYGWKYYSSCKTKFSFINPSLACGTASKFNKSNPIVLKEKLTNFIADKKNAGEASTISVYFRDLEDGPVMGIDEDELFISASLLKLPIVLTFFRLAEDGAPHILDQNILYELGKNAGPPPAQYFIPIKSAVPGSTYSVNELIYYSLVYSDNSAIEILKTYLKNIGNGQDLILGTFKDLGLTEPSSLSTSDISTRGYASIFRQLFNASYLSNESSEKVLSVLSESQFKSGLTVGVPEGVRVAHKFGEREMGEEKQLHDCGIVYYPGNPYLICVMTRGKNYDTLAHVVGDISKMVYDEMNIRAKALAK